MTYMCVYNNNNNNVSIIIAINRRNAKTVNNKDTKGWHAHGFISSAKTEHAMA